uniref:Zgc:66448 n=1 Tax=Seriola dumerili TaxID=41447 RepID=A0A3B4UKR1_SERDU
MLLYMLCSRAVKLLMLLLVQYCLKSPDTLTTLSSSTCNLQLLPYIVVIQLFAEKVQQGAHVDDNIVADATEVHKEENSHDNDKKSTEKELEELVGDADGIEDVVEDDEEADRGGDADSAAKPKKCRLVCKECGKKFNRRETFNLHRHFHAHEDELMPLTCKECGLSFQHRSSLIKHRNEHKEKEEQLEGCFECAELCGKGFRFSSYLQQHLIIHTGKKPYKCPDCGKDFSCGRNYSRASALDAHRRCHEEKLVKSRNRSSGDSFHTEEPFYCSECKKSFNGHIALFNHQRWHANHSDDSAKRFPCEECGKVFMTLTFYYRHQRMAHSDETPAKSFLHQVCQLQKKSFECKDCGLKFSRASALHSHQLHHTDVFRETEKEAQMPTSLLPQQKSLESERKETEHLEEKMESEKVFPTSITEEDSQVNETDEDMESYEPGDFNVQVISASESEDEPVQDLNPDLELLCESDQEIRDDGDTEVSPSSLFSKPEMDLKIVQIDFEQVDEQCAQIARESENETTGERFDCPECYRWFSSASSLRVHRMWHGVHKRRQQTQGHNDALYQTEGSEKKNLTCSECGKCFSRLSALVSHQLHHPKRKQFQCPDCMMSYLHAASLFNHMKNCSAQKKENISVTKKEYNPKKTLLGPKIYHCEQCGKGVAGSLHSVNGHPRSSIKVACPVCGRKFRHKGIMALHMRKHENGNHKCELCNRSFRLFSSLLRHQVHQVEQLKKNTYSCPDCGKLFSRAKALQFHMKSHGYETGHSPSSPRSTVTLEDLQCATCLAHFNNKASLRPVHYLAGTAGSDPPEESKSETVQPQAGQDLDESKSQETNMYREHKYWEWECFECDMGFDDVAHLHLHYIKHATGELPFPQYDIEG